jgi:hypothetical protein
VNVYNVTVPYILLSFDEMKDKGYIKDLASQSLDGRPIFSQCCGASFCATEDHMNGEVTQGDYFTGIQFGVNFDVSKLKDVEFQPSKLMPYDESLGYVVKGSRKFHYEHVRLGYDVLTFKLSDLT